MEPIALLDFDPDTGLSLFDIKNQDCLHGYIGLICFFRDAIERYVAEHPELEIMRAERWQTLPLPLYVDHAKRRVLMLGGVSGANVSSQVEWMRALGICTVYYCGGAGVLNDLAVGHLILPDRALRDEGTSFHYAAPSRIIQADPMALATIEKALQQQKLPYVKGMTWAIDAAYRETKAKVANRRQEGCLCVEMEAAGLFAMAQFYDMRIAGIFYGGDSLSGEEWDNRQWNTQKEIRYELLQFLLSCVDVSRETRKEEQ